MPEDIKYFPEKKYSSFDGTYNYEEERGRAPRVAVRNRPTDPYRLEDSCYERRDREKMKKQRER